MISPHELEQRLHTLSNLTTQMRLSMLNEIAPSMTFSVPCSRIPETGLCSNCAKCCQRVLPLSKEEIRSITELLKGNPLLRKYVLSLNKDLPLRMCPFMDFTQDKHKCLIYDSTARPLICKTYTCDYDAMMKDPPESHYPPGTKLSRTDMWHTFLGKSTSAADIAPAWTNMGLLMEFGMYLRPELLQTPEKLLATFSNFPWMEVMLGCLPRDEIPKILLVKPSNELARRHLGYIANEKHRQNRQE